MIAINDSMSINFSDDLEKTLRSMSDSLVEGGEMIGTSTSEPGLEEIRLAAKDMKKNVEISEIPQSVHYPNNLFLYKIQK